MALVAAWGETGRAADEEAVLRWLEALPPPDLTAGDGQERATVTAYVPVNDATMPRFRSGGNPSEKQVSAGLSLLPENRSKQARHFPAVRCSNEVAAFRWKASAEPQQIALLSRLVGKVTYLGHSSSPVQCWILNERKAAELVPTWVPTSDQSGQMRLRIPAAGRFEDLVARFQAGQRPTSGIWVGYDRPQPPELPAHHPSCFDPNLIILRQTGGRRFGLETTLQLTRALRDCLIKLWSEVNGGSPEWLTGHAPDGRPTQRDHAGFIPLPHVGREHADGHLLGLAVVMPRNLSAEELGGGFGSILFESATGEPRPIRLVLGKLGVCELELEDRTQRPMALLPETWTGLGTAPSRRWATVTPICLNRHPKTKQPELEIEADVSAACDRIGLNGLAEAVLAAPVSMFVGSPTSRSFPNLQRKSGGSIWHTHAIITFKQPVIGPVLLGAGRYRGYGFCRPLRSEEVFG
jgi:CRISPR-associated protein Csb2